MRHLRPLLLLAALAVLPAACDGAAGLTPSAPPSGASGDGGARDEDTTAAPSENASAPTILGQQVLTDADGMTIYYFRKDEPGKSVCYDPCDVTWPPVPADEQIDTSAMDPELLTPIARDDGTEQLAYDGRALYLFKDDLEPGDLEGQGVGNVWFAVAVDGSEIGPQGGVRIGSTDAGQVLIDPKGYTLYTFDDDEDGASNCNGPCTETWLPVRGDTAIDTTLDADQFDTITREDGSVQLALEGRPLYRFVDDANPGDANGEGVGRVWFAVPADDVAPADEDLGAVTVGHTDLGPTLVDGEGRTLYAFANDAFVSDADGQSACNDTCAEAWPPVPADVEVDDAVTGDTRTITRRDGSGQLAIGDWPLYTSARDEGPGDLTGQGGSGSWFAVAPDGTFYEE